MTEVRPPNAINFLPRGLNVYFPPRCWPWIEYRGPCSDERREYVAAALLAGKLGTLLVTSTPRAA